jgi:hyperosmotically inducible protein
MKTTNVYKQKILANRVLVITCLSAVLGLAGCQEEGTAEKTGKEIDRAAEKTEQKIEQVTEKAEKKIEGVKESVTEKVETAEEYVEDSVITTKVKAAILNDSMLKSSNIEVTTVNGVVKLSGTVASEEAVDRAINAADSQKGVKSVETAELVVNEPGK